MPRLTYQNDSRVRIKLHSKGTVIKTGQALFQKFLAHVPCGCLVHETKQGYRCTGCGIIAPNMSDLFDI